ncbi:MAG: SH3 domain-containing protein [Hyphomicrobium sp.]|nr:SH3 domain-containing protein [Hyphomicrobium sp.]
MLTRALAISLGGLLLAAQPAAATTDGICFGMANVPPSDDLNMRSRPHAHAPIVARFGNSSEVILAKVGRCGRWCRVAASTQYGTKRGWINAHYLRVRECP